MMRNLLVVVAAVTLAACQAAKLTDKTLVGNGANDLDSGVNNAEETIQVLQQQVAALMERVGVLETEPRESLVACASSPCENGGTCIDVNFDIFVCMCRDGYFGITCGETATEACSSSPCENGGTCHDVNVDTFICSCRDGYFGRTCEESYADTMFLASVSPHVLNPSNPIVWNVSKINPGGHYDVTTGIYTVPLDGTYEFRAQIRAMNDNAFGLNLVVDDVLITFSYAAEDNNQDHSIDMSVIQSLTAGQQVWVIPFDMTEMYGDTGDRMDSWFYGHLIHAV